MTAEPDLIFLSYAKEDADTVRHLRARLQKDGFNAWMDEHNLLPGQEWDGAVRAAIRRSKAFILFLSKSAVTKAGYIQKEIREALAVTETLPDERVFIIPVRLDECVVPDRLRKWQWIDLRKSADYARLRASLLEHGGIRLTGVKPLTFENATPFADPADHLLYKLVIDAGRLLYAWRPLEPGLRYGCWVVSQGHFILVRPKLLRCFRELKGSISDIRRLSAEEVEHALPFYGPSPRRRELAHTVFASALDFDVVVLVSNEATAVVDANYWRLALLAITNTPTVYVRTSDGPVHIHGGSFPAPAMAIMPVGLKTKELRFVEREIQIRKKLQFLQLRSTRRPTQTASKS